MDVSVATEGLACWSSRVALSSDQKWNNTALAIGLPFGHFFPCSEAFRQLLQHHQVTVQI